LLRVEFVRLSGLRKRAVVVGPPLNKWVRLGGSMIRKVSRLRASLAARPSGKGSGVSNRDNGAFGLWPISVKRFQPANRVRTVALRGTQMVSFEGASKNVKLSTESRKAPFSPYSPAARTVGNSRETLSSHDAWLPTWHTRNVARASTKEASDP